MRSAMLTRHALCAAIRTAARMAVVFKSSPPTHESTHLTNTVCMHHTHASHCVTHLKVCRTCCMHTHQHRNSTGSLLIPPTPPKACWSSCTHNARAVSHPISPQQLPASKLTSSCHGRRPSPNRLLLPQHTNCHLDGSSDQQQRPASSPHRSASQLNGSGCTQLKTHNTRIRPSKRARLAALQFKHRTVMQGAQRVHVHHAFCAHCKRRYRQRTHSCPASRTDGSTRVALAPSGGGQQAKACSCS